MPFIRTTGNIFKRTYERTPAGLFTTVRRACGGGSNADCQQAMAQVVTGTMLGFGIMEMVTSGVFTGGGPADPATKKIYHEAGIEPYSFVDPTTGKSMFTIDRLDPLGGIIVAFADYADIAASATTQERDEIIGRLTASLGRQLLDRSFASSTRDMFEALSGDDPKKLGRLMKNIIASATVPSAERQIAKNIDPDLRQADNLIQEIRARTPFGSKELAPIPNLWGDPTIRPGYFDPLVAMIGPENAPIPLFSTPFKVVKTDGWKEPINKEIVRLNEAGVPMHIQNPPKFISGDVAGSPVVVQLTQNQWVDYVRLSGQPAKKALNKLITTDEYKRAGNELQGLIIKSVLQAWRQPAKEQLLAKHEELRHRYENAIEAQAQRLQNSPQ